MLQVAVPETNLDLDQSVKISHVLSGAITARVVSNVISKCNELMQQDANCLSSLKSDVFEKLQHVWLDNLIAINPQLPVSYAKPVATTTHLHPDVNPHRSTSRGRLSLFADLPLSIAKYPEAFVSPCYSSDLKLSQSQNEHDSNTDKLISNEKRFDTVTLLNFSHKSASKLSVCKIYFCDVLHLL